jgi:hypothetical protein
VYGDVEQPQQAIEFLGQALSIFEELERPEAAQVRGWLGKLVSSERR